MDTTRDLYLDLMTRCLTDWIYNEAGAPARADGRDWPGRAHTMIGLKRLANLRMCVEAVIAENIPGDLIETGVWRGGAAIFMRAVLKAFDVADRVVWVADSFAGRRSAGRTGRRARSRRRSFSTWQIKHSSGFGRRCF
jgi:Macrocin-O-methyltransferase (TylF)